MTDKLIFAGTVAADGRTIKGSVVLAGSRTFRNGEWLEVDPAALVKADAKDVKGRFDHDPGKVMGRTGNGTVRLSRTETGIDYEIDVNETSFGNDALVMARRGDFGGSSFEIEGLRSTFSTDPDGTRVRRITSIKRLTDVSPVIDPAFANSTVAAFGKEADMTDTAAPEPTVTPPPVPVVAPPATEPVVRFGSDDIYDTTLRFAKTLDKERLENAMDTLIEGGELKGDRLAQYKAYATVFGEITKADDDERASADRFKLMHDIRLGRKPKAPEGRGEQFASKDYAEAFTQYLRTGNSRQLESFAQSFAQSVAGDGTQGGFFVPDGFLQRITERQKAYGGIAGISDTITTANGEPLRWPSNDDTGNTAAIAAEGAAGAAGADVVLGNLTLGAFSYDANGASNLPLKVSLELIQDAAFDVDSFVSRKLGQRIGRKQARDFAVGVGTTEPFGLLSKTPDAMTATKTRKAANEMVFQVDSAYRDEGNCRFVMSDTTLAKYWDATDLNGRPLFIPEAQSGLDGQPGSAGRLVGYPVTLDQASGDLVAFGDIRQGYIIRYIRSVQVLVDPYSASGTRQITYHAWARADAGVQDSFAYSVSTFASVTADATA